MAPSNPAQIVRHLLEGPLTRPSLMRWRERQFLSPEGFASYYGVFGSFAEAREFLPPSLEFDDEALTEEYVSVRTKKIFTYDYPMLWWLSSAFASGATRILDVGGSVGVHYYAYQSWLRMPMNLAWDVVEVPAVARVGERLARERGAEALSFSADLSEAVSQTRADIWIAAGSLQYLEDPPLDALLAQCRHRPRHLLLNKLPLYDGDDFVTAQNLGEFCFSPVHIFNRARFIDAIVAQGYVLKDEWTVHERAFYLPGYAQRCFSCFTGLYFVAEGRA